MKSLKYLLSVLLLIAVPAYAQQQPSVAQKGTITNGHIATWAGPGYIQDGGNPAGTGTVTSVALAAPASICTVSGSPVTGAGTLTCTAPSTTQNFVLAGPASGGPGAYSFRALVGADFPVATTTTLGVAEFPANAGLTVTAGSVILASPSTTVLGGVLSNGTSPTSNEVVQYINNSGSPVLHQVQFSEVGGTLGFSQGGTGLTALGTSNQCLTTNNATSGMQWQACTGTGSALPLGTAASATNPQRSGEVGTGFYSAAAGTVSLAVTVAGTGTDIIDFSSIGGAFKTTGAVTLPYGTTAQRPSPSNGMLRVNSTVPQVEAFFNGVWNVLGSVALPVVPANGGTGQNFSASTGALQFSSGTASVGIITSSNGGTGQNFGASSGALQYSSGTASLGIITATNGGTGQNFSSANGVLQFTSGTAAAGTVTTANGGTGINLSASTGLLKVASGTVSATTALPSTTTATTQTINDTSTAVATDAFVNPGTSITGNGYRKEPDSTINQWGSVAGSIATIPVTFPLSFPNNCFSVTISQVGDSGGAPVYLTAPCTTTGFSVVNASSSVTTIYWQAVGN